MHPSHPTPDGAKGADARTRYLGVDGLRDGLTQRAIRGGIVTLAAQAVKVAVQAGAIVLLARLLAPSDFGLFAMVAAFLAVLEIFKDFGLSTATVQCDEISDQQVSTLFWLNAALGLSVAAIAALSAPLLTWLYGEPALLGITPVVAVAFLFTGIAAQHLALLRRQMAFLAVVWVQVFAEIVAMTAAVAAAFLGAGYWALAIQRVVWAAAIAIGAWTACGWRPSKPGRMADVKGLIAFGGNATAAMTVGHLAGSLDKILIGWLWGATALGFFERAQKLILMPMLNMTTPLSAVGISALSRLASEPVRYREAYLATVERLAMVIAPVGGLVMAAADPIVLFVLGPQWTAAGPILAWLGIGMLYMTVTYTLSWLYMSQDRTPEMFRAGIVNAAMTVIAILCGLPFGAVGVAAALGLSGAIRAPVLFWLVARQGPVGMRDLCGVLAMPIAAAAATACAVVAMRAVDGFDALSAPSTVVVLSVAAVAISLAVYGAVPHSRRILGHGLRTSAIFFRREAKA